MRTWILWIVLFTGVVGFFGWRAGADTLRGMRERRLASQEHAFICESLLTQDVFLRACPSAASLDRLRVMSVSVRFPHVNKCTISVTAPGERPATLIVVVDQFSSAELAQERFRLRRHDAVFTAEDVVPLEGVQSLYDQILNERALILVRDRMVAEIAPSGGGLCPKDELFELGKSLAQRLVLFLPREEGL